MGFNEGGTVVFTAKPYSQQLSVGSVLVTAPLFCTSASLPTFVLSIWIKKSKCYLTWRVGKPAQHPVKSSDRREQGVGDKPHMCLCAKAWIGVQTLLLQVALRPVPFKVEVKRWA